MPLPCYFFQVLEEKKNQKMVIPSPRGYIQVTSPDIIKQFSINIKHVSLPLHMHIRTRSQKTNEFIGSCIFLRGENTLINQDIDLEVLPKCTHTVHLNHALWTRSPRARITSCKHACQCSISTHEIYYQPRAVSLYKLKKKKESCNRQSTQRW